MRRRAEKAMARAKLTQRGAELHAEVVAAVETGELSPLVSPVVTGALCVLGGDLAAGFLAAECAKRCAAAKLKARRSGRKGKR